jgi:hypothetical protein
MKEYRQNPTLQNDLLPVDIVLHPSWWYHHAGITFDPDFYFDPRKRVESEQKMEQVLYDRWGKFGLGEHRDKKRPEVGPVHLAAGFILSEMMGCEVEYKVDAPPQVKPANREDLRLDSETPFHSKVFTRYRDTVETLHEEYGYLTGDINWGGVLNLALDLRGQSIFMDLFDRGEEVRIFFDTIAEIIEKFTGWVQERTGTSSISVNRNVRNVDSKIFLHSECSHTMISEADYHNYLFPIDERWSKRYRPYGIHYCGEDPHRFAEHFARLPFLDFLDVGWGGDVATLRKHLPDTFLNIRLSPVELVSMSTEEVQQTITELVHQADNPYLTGVCCINMDDKVQDEKITAIFETTEELRKEYRCED